MQLREGRRIKPTANGLKNGDRKFPQMLEAGITRQAGGYFENDPGGVFREKSMANFG